MRYVKIAGFALLLGAAVFFAMRFFWQEEFYKQIIARLTADSRVAEVLVVGVNYNEELKKNFTTIKFVEYDVTNNPMETRFFTFPGNIIQFQSLVVRFDDRFVAGGDRLRGKSAYLFWKVFCLDGPNTREFNITDVKDVPGGYKIARKPGGFERRFWKDFWVYAFDRNKAARAGVKNVQIEAPGAMFVPGYLYTIKIEHHGGLRIDMNPLPGILKKERARS